MKISLTKISSNLLICICATIVLYSCSNDDQEQPINPNIDILGKWEITHLGNGDNVNPIENPLGYREYLIDSVLNSYIYENESLENRKYWIKDSILFESFALVDVIDNDTIIYTNPYKFEFLDKNTLRLILQKPFLNTTSIHKRIN